MHFREAKRLDLKTLLQRANMDKAIDFMDSVEDDVPRGKIFTIFEIASMHACQAIVSFTPRKYILPD